MTLVLFEWTCPLCGVSGARITNQGDPVIVGVSSLESHIRSSIGDGHGRPGALPAEMDPGDLEHEVSSRPLRG